MSSVCVSPGPSQPTGRLPLKRSMMSIERLIIAGLVLDLVDRHLVVGVAHELPAGRFASSATRGVVLADARIDRERRPDAEPLVELEEAPAADPHAVFVPAPVRHVRKQRQRRSARAAPVAAIGRPMSQTS